MVKEKPILFKGEMVRAIQNTKPNVWPAERIDPSKPFKYNTRRIIKPGKRQDWLTPEVLDKVVQMVDRGDGWWAMSVDDRPPGPHGTCPGHIGSVRAPYRVGDILWVRETMKRGAAGWVYAADKSPVVVDPKDQAAMLVWSHHKINGCCVSIHMPRWACRIRLEVMEVRAQRLNDITEADALAEGIQRPEELTAAEVDVWEGAEKIYFDALNQPRLVFERLWDSINGEDAFAKNPWVFAYTFKRLS